MSENSFVPLPGSERGAVPDAQPAGDLDDATRIEVTLVTRRREALPAEVVTGPATLSRDELAARHGTDPSDLALIRDVLGRFGLTVTGADAGARRVTVAGPISAFSQAFGATLRQVSAPHPAANGGMAQHRYRVGGLHVPAELDGVVLAVLGLDDRPQASPQIRRHPGIEAAAAGAAVPTSYTPVQVAQAYSFPAGTDGTGQTIAIIELGGGFGTTDLDTYFSGLGITAPDGDRGRGRRRDERGRAGPAGRRRRGAARHRGRRRAGARGRARSSTSRRTPTPVSSTRSPRRSTPAPDPDGDQHQLGPDRGRVDRRRHAPRWTRRSPTPPRSASP